MSAAVRFNETSEFLAELARDVEQVHRRIVRVSLRFTSAMAPNIRHVELVAGYEVEDGVVGLVMYVGDYWGEPFPRTTLDKADGLQKLIADAATDLGLEVRPGVFEVEPKRTHR